MSNLTSSSAIAPSGEIDTNKLEEVWIPPVLYNYDTDSKKYSLQSQNILVELSQKWFEAKTSEEKKKIERQLLYFRSKNSGDTYIDKKVDEIINEVFGGVAGQLLLNTAGASEDILNDKISNLNKSEVEYVTGVTYDNSYDKYSNIEIICSRSTPQQTGTPNSVQIQRDANGNITKYTQFGSNGEFVKEVRITGKEHGGIPRPNVKEPRYNINEKTGQKYQNGFKVREAESWEIPSIKPIS